MMDKHRHQHHNSPNSGRNHNNNGDNEVRKCVPRTSKRSDFSLNGPTTPFACLYHFILKRKILEENQVCKSESFKFIHGKGKNYYHHQQQQNYYGAGLNKSALSSPNSISTSTSRLLKIPTTQTSGPCGHNDNNNQKKKKERTEKVDVSETYAEPADVLSDLIHRRCQQQRQQEQQQQQKFLRTRIETHQLDVSSTSTSSSSSKELERKEPPETEQGQQVEGEEDEDDCPYHEIYLSNSGGGANSHTYKAPYYYSDVIQERRSQSSLTNYLNSVVAPPSSIVQHQQKQSIEKIINYFHHPVPVPVLQEQNRIKCKIHSHYHTEEEKKVKKERNNNNKYYNNWVDSYDDHYKWNKWSSSSGSSSKKTTELEEDDHFPLESLYVSCSDKILSPSSSQNSIRHRHRLRRRTRKRGGGGEEEEEDRRRRRKREKETTKKEQGIREDKIIICDIKYCQNNHNNNYSCRRSKPLEESRSDLIHNHNNFYQKSDYSMARKRYETAFLPSNTISNDPNHSPDVDSLLLAIESSSTSIVDLDTSQQKQQNDEHHHHRHQPIIMRHTNYNDHHRQEQHDCDESALSFLRSSHSPVTIVRPLVHYHDHQMDHDNKVHLDQSSPSVSKLYHCHQHCEVSSKIITSSSPPLTPSKQQRNLNAKDDNEVVHGSSGSILQDLPFSGKEANEEQFDSRTDDDPGLLNFDSLNLCSPRKLNNPNPNLPLSEPLPIKRYANNNNAHSSSGRGGKLLYSSGDKRNLTKENSISSLESLNSTQSEDLQMQLQTQNFSFSKIRGGHHHQHHHHFGGNKVLSPISDKSPLEPKSTQLLQQTDIFANSHHHHHQQSQQWDSQNLLHNSAELTNVPWECPKLRRKLALLADSGISLDLPPSSGNSARDFDFHFTTSSSSYNSNSGSSTSRDRGVRDYDQESSSGHHVPPPPPPSFSYGDINNCGQQEKRGNLDLKLPLRRDSDFILDGDGDGGGGVDQDYNYATTNRGFNIEERGNYLSTSKPDRGKVWLDFSGASQRQQSKAAAMMPKIDFDPELELECQDWFHGAVTRSEAEAILRPTKEGSFLVRNCERSCESSNFNQYSVSLKCVRGFIHIRIEPNSLGTFTLGDQEFPTVPYLIQHFMLHRLPIKGAEHVKLIHPVKGGWL